MGLAIICINTLYILWFSALKSTQDVYICQKSHTVYDYSNRHWLYLHRWVKQNNLYRTIFIIILTKKQPFYLCVNCWGFCKDNNVFGELECFINNWCCLFLYPFTMMSFSEILFKWREFIVWRWDPGGEK